MFLRELTFDKHDFGKRKNRKRCPTVGKRGHIKNDALTKSSKCIQVMKMEEVEDKT